MDHKALTASDGVSAQRTNVDDPSSSLILSKPTLQEDHEGGQRFEQDSWQFRMLRTWIAHGAQRQVARRQLQRLEVQPAEILLSEPGTAERLRVIATWEDGTREDVTCLCRFQTNDESVAAIDSEAIVRATGRGDTHIIVFYDNGVTAVPVLIPVQAAVASYPVVETPTRVDELVVAKLRKLGIEPSALCNDAEFLRRVSIDLTGTLPTPTEVESFLADPSSNKRIRKIDELLETPAYAAWWANKLCDYTGNSPYRQSELGQELSVKWYGWLYQRVSDNMPYDQIVAGIVAATSRSEGQSYDEYAAEMSSYFREQEPADFAARDNLPMYWSRRNLDSPEDKALAFAHSFLGVRLACAQCHKHPYDQWTQNDFQRFAGFFSGLRYGIAPESRESHRRLAETVGQRRRGDQGAPVNRDLLALAMDGNSVPWRELYFDPAKARPASELKLLGEANLQVAGQEDPRAELLSWLRRPDNPYFARAFVNRVWAHYFHRGIVEPADDLNLANPPSNRQLLEYLQRAFVESGYDMKWLHREITRSHTYQRSRHANHTNRLDTRNFSHFIPRRIPAEVVYDALKQATAASEQLAEIRADLDRRASGHLSTLMAGTYAMRVFGKPDRIVQCDCERTNEPSLLQSIFLQNDPLVQQRLTESGWLREVEQAMSESTPSAAHDRELIREAYLRTVSRPPTNDETSRAEQYLASADSRIDGLQDLLWALFNSKEFILNH